MNGSLSRRAVLQNAGAAAAFGTLAANLSAVVRAAEEQGDAAICLSMIYPNSPKAKFDARRYASKHLPLLKSIYGDSIEQVELRTPRQPDRAARRSGSGASPAARPTMGPPPSVILAATSLWIRDLKAFGEKTAAAGDQIAKDLEDVVTESRPVVQYDRTIVLLGEARSAITQQSQVFTSYFPSSETSQFDAKYYGETVVPLMMKLYGSKAIRRVEVTLGQSGQGGSKPAMVAAAHYYIRDRTAWDTAGRLAFPQLMAEGPKYTNIRPLAADTEVSASA